MASNTVYIGNNHIEANLDADKHRAEGVERQNPTNSIFIGLRAGNIHTRGNGIVVIGDNILGSEGGRDFIIEPVPSITENYDQSLTFLRNYGAAIYMINHRHRCYSSDQTIMLLKALSAINKKCGDRAIGGYLTNEEVENFVARSSSITNDYHQAVNFLQNYGAAVYMINHHFHHRSEMERAAMLESMDEPIKTCGDLVYERDTR